MHTQEPSKTYCNHTRRGVKKSTQVNNTYAIINCGKFYAILQYLFSFYSGYLNFHFLCTNSEKEMEKNVTQLLFFFNITNETKENEIHKNFHLIKKTSCLL